MQRFLASSNYKIVDKSGTKYPTAVKTKGPLMVGLIFLLALIATPTLALIYSLAYKGTAASQRTIEPPAFAYLKTPVYRARTARIPPPILVNNSPGSAVSFGQQGGITAGTVNQFGVKPPEPKLKWAPANLPQPADAKHPRTFGTLSVDHAYESAR